MERFDVAAIGRGERTPQGFLRVPAFLTREGVFVYKRADGTSIREYRPADEVFAPTSLATLAAAPLTDLHPAEMVSPANVRSLAIGHVSESVRRDGRHVAASITVQDAGAIAKVEAGQRREVSLGYRCRIDATPGTHNGEAYDVVQRDIVYNHAALGPKNWGRAGSDVALRLDSSDAALLDATHDAPPDDRRDEKDKDSTMDTASIRVDGIDVEVPKQWSQLLERALATRDTQITQLTGARDAVQGRLDAVSAELATAKVQLTAAQDPARLDSAVNARAALLEQARRVLPSEHKFDGQSPRQIHEAVLTKLDAKLALKDRSDEYVQARFDHAIDTLPATTAPRTDGLGTLRELTGTRPAAAAAAATRIDSGPHIPAWQQPLSTSKDRRQS